MLGFCVEATTIDTYCAIANSTTKCVQCIGGSYLVPATCVQCGVNCTSCADNVTCTECNNGYTFASPVNRTCVVAPKNLDVTSYGKIFFVLGCAFMYLLLLNN